MSKETETLKPADVAGRLDGLVRRLRQHALPDPHDEREVLHAPLLTEAADAIERLWAAMATATGWRMENIPDYADLISADEFSKLVDAGGFVSSDGSGCWATKFYMDNDSNVWASSRPEWATHVAWFNK